MNINSEILDIIKDQDFLVLPGLGSFIAEFSKPYINIKGELIQSNKTLNFEPIINKDYDQKLLKILSEKGSLPKQYVHKEFDDLFIDIFHQLKTTGKYEWPNLGSFFRQNDGSIAFFFEKNFNNTVVEPVYLPEKIELVSNEKNILNESESLEIDLPKNIKPKNGSIESYKVLYYLVPILFLIGTLGYSIFMKPDINEKISSSPFVAGLDSINNFQDEIDTNTNNVNAIEENTYTIDRPKENPSPSSSSPEIKDPANGTIISIGVFENSENVNLLANSLSENGLPVKIKPYKGKYKLYAVSYSEEQTEELTRKILELTGEKPHVAQ